MRTNLYKNSEEQQNIWPVSKMNELLNSLLIFAHVNILLYHESSFGASDIISFKYILTTNIMTCFYLSHYSLLHSSLAHRHKLTKMIL